MTPKRMKKMFNYDIENKLWLFMTRDEEEAYYDEVLTRVVNNSRFYLDNLDELSVFRVSFKKYKPEKMKSFIN